jgi:hypothetical protein
VEQQFICRNCWFAERGSDGCFDRCRNDHLFIGYQLYGNKVHYCHCFTCGYKRNCKFMYGCNNNAHRCYNRRGMEWRQCNNSDRIFFGCGEWCGSRDCNYNLYDKYNWLFSDKSCNCKCHTYCNNGFADSMHGGWCYRK